MTLRKNYLSIALLLISFESSALAAFATQEDSRINKLLSFDIKELSNITFTVSKESENTFLAPGTVYVITESDIEKHGWRHLQDALRAVPSVYLYDPHSWVWGGQRGLVSNFSQTLLMINGREVNNLIASEGFISRQFTTHNIKQIEVMASPGSALYGANALAGIINIITKDADENFDSIEVALDYGSFNSKGASFVFGKQIGKIRISGSGQINDSDEADYLDFVRDGGNFAKGWADYPLAVGQVTSFKNPAKGQALNLRADFKEAYIGFNHYSNRQSHGLETLRWDYTSAEDHRNFDLFYGGINTSLSENITIKAEYQHTNSKLWGIYSSARNPVARLEAADGLDIFQFDIADVVNPALSFAQNLINNGYLTAGAITEADIAQYFSHIYSNKNSQGSTRDKFEFQLNWTLNKRARLLLGYTYDNIDYIGLAVTDAASGVGRTFEVPLDVSKRKASYTNKKHGGFVQLKYDVIVNRLFLTAGIRLDDQNHYGSTTNPRMGLVWQSEKGSIFKVMYGEAFREPNVFELAGNDSVQPAKLKSFEMNFSQSIKKVANISITGYKNKVSNFLGSVGSVIGTGVGQVEKQDVTGLEFETKLIKNKFEAFANGSFILSGSQGFLDDTTGLRQDTELLSLPKSRANFGLTYAVTPKLNASIFYSYTAAYDAVSGNRNITDIFRISDAHKLNATLSLSEQVLFGRKIEAFLKATNLTNSKIFEANIRRSGPHKFLQDGRAIYVRLVTKW